LSNCKPERIDLGKFKDNDFDDDRRPEIADKTGNTYIAETITDGIKLSTAKLQGFTTMESSKKISPESA